MKGKISSAVVLFFLTTCTWSGCSIDAQGRYVVGTPGFGNARLYEKPSPVIGIKDRSDVINKYLANKELAPIEGVWVWDSNRYEVAIIRNNTEHYKEYDYVGVVTDTRDDAWTRGQIKMLLK